MYDKVHQFEPLLPQKGLETLRERSRLIIAGSLEFSSRTHESTRQELRELVRSMNSYYSNRIEGQGTHPANIERALRQDFSEQPAIAKLQRIALAHMEAEKALEARLQAGALPLSSAFAIEAHQALYGRLSQEDRTSAPGMVVLPGIIRSENVSVGRHVPPAWESISQFLARFDAVYARNHGWDDMLIATACAHQRMAWIHPFPDGNGRAVRLQTHAALWSISHGLWSPNRGLARQRDEYYARLADADAPRRGDLDGRGNLSEEGLVRWVQFFLGICEDQVMFMKAMFDLDNMKRRIEALIAFRAAQDKAIRLQSVLPLYHLFSAGPLSRGEFQQMTGLGTRLARTLLSRLLATGLVKSDGPYAPVRFAMPLDALQFLFPDLYPEAATREI